MFESDADRLAMIQAVGGSQYTIDGRAVSAILIDEHEPLDVGGQLLTAHAPYLHCRASDVKGIAPNAPVTGADVPYVVAEVLPDGTGMMLLRLREVGP